MKFACTPLTLVMPALILSGIAWGSVPPATGQGGGTTDPNYSLMSGTTFLVKKMPTSWGSQAGAQWIGPTADGSHVNGTNGNYIFTLNFTVAAANLSKANLTMSVLADPDVDIQLNGVFIFHGCPCVSTPGTATINSASGLLPGANTLTFFLSDFGPGSPPAGLNVLFTGTLGDDAGGMGTVQVSPQSLAFSAPSGGDSAPPQTIWITPGAGVNSPVNFAVSVDSGSPGSAAPSWISVNPLSGVTPGGLTIVASPGNMNAGTYPATLHITVPGNTSQAPINIPVVFTITPGKPQIEVSPASLNLGARVQTPGMQDQVIVLRNSGGGGPLSFTTSIVGQSSWISSVTPAAGQTSPNSPVFVHLLINSQGLNVGNFHDILRITWSGNNGPGSVTDVAISLFVSAQGAIISVDLTGLRFDERQGNGNGQTQSVRVLDLGDPSSSVNWTASVLTGSDWAILGNASGTSTPTNPGSFSVTAGGDASNLPIGGSWALIQIIDKNALNSPQYLVAVLAVQSATSPADPHVSPAGLFFNNSTASQTVKIFASSATPVAFQASASALNGGSWLSVTPVSGTVSTQNPGSISVSVASGLPNGIYLGTINVSMNGIVRSVNVTLVVTGSTSTSGESPRAAGCAPAKLAPVETGVPNNFAVPAGWPSSLIVLLNDDCGNAVSNGSVVASFSNGDPPLTLRGDQHSNIYSATWQPTTVVPSMSVTMRAASGSLQPATQQFTGAVQANASPAPTLIPNGSLHIFFDVPTANALGNGLAPGNVAQIYGTGMASMAQSPGVVPLVNQFNGTFMLIGGIQAPLYYVSSGLIDIQVPAELTPNRQYTAIVSANGALTLPETLNIVPVQPGMAAFADGTVIAQHAADFSLVTADHPAKPGEALVIYLAGMGATNPPVASGALTPLQLVPATVQPTISVDNQPAVIGYAGLTPSGIGLYQINFTVPPNARSGNLSLQVMQGGLSSNTTKLPVAN